MNRQRTHRTAGRASGAPRVRTARTAAPAARTDTPAGTTAPEGAVISFLSEVLVGDNSWTMAEVQRLVVVRDLADLGRWRAAGLDDEDPGAE
jgi:hypothetical protein